MASWKQAFTISIDEVKAATPPGTVVVIDDATTEESDGPVRFPIPSASAADPLNWPMWRKHALLIVLSTYSWVANFSASNIAPALQMWPMFFPRDQRTFPELTRLVALTALMIGVGNIWWVPMSNILGRRPVLLVSMLILTLCSVWAALATDYNSLMGARIMQGIGAAAADTVAPAAIGEVYFLHERGRVMAVYTIFLATGSLTGGLAGGSIAVKLGWSYIFWIVTALSAACFLGTVFLVPESLYDRVIEAQNSTPASSSPTPSRTDFTKELEKHEPQDVVELSAQNAPPTLNTWFGFRKPRSHFLQACLNPWRSLELPACWVVTLIYGALIGGIVTISTIGPQLLAQPPYLWSGSNVGLINVGGLVGTVLGAVYTYLVSDTMVKKTKHGYIEAESRLPIMFPSLFISTAGFLVFGFCAQNPGPKVWVGLEVGHAMITFGLVQAPSVGFSYLIDAYAHLAADCFVIAAILRAVIGFAWSIFVADWIQSRGAAEPFGIFGMLMGIFSLMVVPLWLWGKRMRMATAGVFGAAKLDEDSS